MIRTASIRLEKPTRVFIGDACYNLDDGPYQEVIAALEKRGWGKETLDTPLPVKLKHLPGWCFYANAGDDGCYDSQSGHFYSADAANISLVTEDAWHQNSTDWHPDFIKKQYAGRWFDVPAGELSVSRDDETGDITFTGADGIFEVVHTNT